MLLGAGCSSSQPDTRSEPRARPASPVFDSGPSLPVGAIASTRGSFGEVRVDEVDGQRRLLIDGMVQGVRPLGDAAERQGPDPIVSLIRTARPAAKTVLCIGLGTGKTSMDLARAGLDVTTIEVQAAVIEYARTYFDYDGKVIQADGYRFLRKSTDAYDVVLMDAFIGMDPPNDLISKRGVRAMSARTAANGLTIIRGLGEPRDFLYERIHRELREAGPAPRFVEFLGSGVGAEIQNLYLIASDTAINFVNVAGLPMWPVHIASDGPAWAEPTSQGGERRIRLVGYVVRLREGGLLALDLPHWEMGAVRYLLSGDAVPQLARLLGKTSSFPTNGDIRSDGDTSRTLQEVLGGGGAKRSDVRFSPLVAILEGTASLRSVVDPDAASALPASVRGDAPTDPLLPYGGALYDLRVDKVTWTLDRARWKKLAARAAPHLDQATGAIAKGRLAGAETAIGSYLDVVANALEPFMPPRADVTRIAAAIHAEVETAPADAGVFTVAGACDRALVAVDDGGPLDASAALRLRASLQECAVTSYEREAADHRNPDAIAAAKRLFYLWDHLPLTDAQQARAERKRADLERKYRGPNPSPEPPERPAPPP